MTLKAVIFDVDDTLADTEEAHRHAFNDAFREFGLPWRWRDGGYMITQDSARARTAPPGHVR